MKKETEFRYESAIEDVASFLRSHESTNCDIDSISEVKGLFNRIAKEDQWDWFTVYVKFGEPSKKEVYRFVRILKNLRKAILEKDDNSTIHLKKEMINNNFIHYSINFLDENYEFNSDRDDGYSSKGSKLARLNNFLTGHIKSSNPFNVLVIISSI